MDFLSQKSKGFIFAFVTILIWAGWMIVTRLGVSTNLSPLDVTFLRFTTAGILLFPVSFHYRREIFKTPKIVLLLMLIGAGAPYVWMSALGFRSAPASHGVLIPGTMPLWVALFSRILFKETFSKNRLLGYLFIFLGMSYKLYLSSVEGLHTLLFDAYFLCAAILWAIYTVSNLFSSLSPLLATAWVTSGSMIGLALPYLLYQFQYPHPLAWKGSLLQIFYQGVVTSIISLITYNRAIQLIGSSYASAFAAFVPSMVILLAIPFLRETPSLKDFIFIALMSFGVLLASGIYLERVKT